MDDLIKEVRNRTGLSEDQAKDAAEAVINFLKQRLPEPAAGIVSQFLGDAEGADTDEARKKKRTAIAAMAATTAAVNVVVLPGAH